ncbi:GFA family protein [Reinekea blandensis]|uniref:Glutathione-dependent formaldehyde-activating, GFA n=1 Tax=Reinekea blandensis MED297 TaxID=314283 RepID=A4BHU6_9GAMM|nr:GFA family protein [Reinekea blandensis]EAR08351.1 Glutathione-dependent formaldehyde-activating, GFA [Reinekea sp. MED297] [Reinekea blandensis MED297]
MLTYQGKCHCGAVTFEVTAEEPLTAGARCNCSLCRRKGFVMALLPSENFRLTGGASELTDYQWNTQQAHHYFCRHCGIYTHHQPRTAPDKIGVNVGCIDELEPLTFDVELRNGQALSIE